MGEILWEIAESSGNRLVLRRPDHPEHTVAYQLSIHNSLPFIGQMKSTLPKATTREEISEQIALLWEGFAIAEEYFGIESANPGSDKGVKIH